MNAFWWALVAACIWGVVPLMEKIGLGGPVSPTAGVMARSIGVVIGLIVFGVGWQPWAAMRSLTWQSFALLAGGGFLASFVGQLAFYRALQSGALSQVTPVAGTYPLVAALLGWWLLKEPLTVTRVLGIACIVLGVVMLRK